MKLTHLLTAMTCALGGVSVHGNEITIATFNVSMESENYVVRGSKLGPEVLANLLAKGNHPQIKNIAAIIQHVQPDILLLNEFDYIKDPKQGIELFIKNYLSVSQSGASPIEYPYYFYQTVNTGVPSGFDLNNDGKIQNGGEDAWGFGNYPGQYGMVVFLLIKTISELFNILNGVTCQVIANLNMLMAVLGLMSKSCSICLYPVNHTGMFR
jgi:hypothetical protein